MTGEDPAAAGKPQVTQDERTWAMLAHLSAFLGLVVPLGFIIAPLVIWLVKREQSAFVADQAKEALNFNITMGIAGIVCLLLTLLLIGVLLLIALGVYWVVLAIVAAIKANEGNAYRYPFTLRFIT
jgi:uncharacterized Tic20 family protein